VHQEGEKLAENGGKHRFHVMESEEKSGFARIAVLFMNAKKAEMERPYGLS
jgi:hypothetical protein